MEIDRPNIESKERKKPKKKKKQVKKKTDEMNSIKLRIYPSKEQHSILAKWFGATRFIYNRCLYYINQEREKPGYKYSEVADVKNLRAKFINNSNYETENTWMKEINYDVRDEAMRDLKDNFKSNFSKKEFFKLKYKTRKSKISVSVLAKHWTHKKGEFSKIFKKMKCEKPLPKKLNYDSRIIKTETGEYYICIPRLLVKKFDYENQITKPINNSEESIVSIDPGVRTFLTCYDQNGCVFEFGKNDIGMLARLNHYKFKLQSEIKKSTNHFNRVNLSKGLRRISLKIKNLIDDCHKKLSKWLCINYRNILIPKLSFHSFEKMSRKNRCKMAIWSHCAFVDRLVEKSREYSGCDVKIVTEEYTSKTCGCCGEIKYDLRSSKTYSCNKCKSIIDRDANGARNILLKYFTENVK
jgi:putative transposase